jgi:hypothetical protein
MCDPNRPPVDAKELRRLVPGFALAAHAVRRLIPPPPAT